MTVTLETLRADFEAAKDHYAQLLGTNTNWECHGPDGCASSYTFEFVVETFEYDRLSQFARSSICKSALIRSRVEAAVAMLDAAHILHIAASFPHESEGLKAAMLYKLSDGAIDPRKAGDA